MSKKFSAGDVEIARRMRETGVPLDLDGIEQALVIWQYGGSGANSLAASYLTSQYIGVTITAYIKVTCNRSVPFTLCGFELRLSYKLTPSTLLTDPADSDAMQIYRFPGYDASRFDKSQIIVQSNQTLHQGQCLEGYLLAIDHDPIPPEIDQGARVIAKLTIFDQLDEGHSSDLVLRVDRSAEWRTKPKALRPRRRLFDQADKKITKLPCDTAVVVGGDDEIIDCASVRE